MLRIINYSLQHKFLVLLLIFSLIGFGTYAILNIPIGAVPDITNNQVQVISTSRNLPTEEVERYLTYPVELEMGNLPGVKEVRSVSKFGLSVVTVVFEDDLGTYLPRQLISEKIKSIADNIPEGFGSPFMGPISTGLGEIYQYILDVKPGYEDRYNVTDLRTIQDWVVKRQLSGIPGVVEVNTWGGFLKNYEVAIDPSKLQSMGISLNEVYEALNKNNTVAGGGYIEKSNEAYFIRAEGLLKSVKDIEDIVVRHLGDSPIFVKDVAKVDFGSALRFGAITGNGEGEKVLGQIMMLKGADSKKVIDAVISRVNEIQSSLPEGIFINPILDRSELIGKTTFTVSENLILGFLIVLFVVVFLLGNLRSGLVVASVIPLTLLFAISLMYLFGIDANLMSLGAIDFGIIIDGAVIIVEYISFNITKNGNYLQSLSPNEKKLATDDLVSKGASKMMHSALFGQIIIIIVFIPILALTGIEGKMFRPMALTFCFALIGAMILCFTYVPVVASLFLKPSDSTNTLSNRCVASMKSWYKPTLMSALKFKKVVLSFAIVLFAFSTFLFTKMGGEFVPTLDEGDFVIQPVLKTGMSLTETVKMTTRIEQIIKRFPEVKQVVSRIGAAEVPTDPMSMEESDVIITLNKKSTWVSASSKDGLANVFKEALTNEIPGVEIEFTQPIEMRFNELISGTRSDLAIKIFGEDLDILYSKANEIENAIKNVEGASDISVEKIAGLPQMTVQYDRVKMARYGVSIDKLNEVISMGFAGKTAGNIYEGESKFDIVLRYDAAHRSNIDDLRNALIDLPSGTQLPLSEFANISNSIGPAKISRDDTKRRVVIGVNVRGRDLESVVNEVSQIIDNKITIPTGYYIQYGGQFENLKNASNRLMVAVPISLILIFILLYFAFGSVREALLIYSAIPLATIGGVLALYVRGMPFSISAGIGFIALFGIAVLNGIVMIEHFKDLKTNGMKKMDDLIVKGALDRLRPVLLTALAAAFGFLPMAISTSAGAEVQRPLATVVIGGLLSATFLTLIVLPILYGLFSSTNKSRTFNSAVALILPFLILLPLSGKSQEIKTLDEVIEMTRDNNLGLKAYQLDVDKQKILIDASREINTTEFNYQYDRNNITENGDVLHVLGVGHKFKMPAVHNSRKRLQESLLSTSESILSLKSYELEAKASLIYDKILYRQELFKIYQQIDSFYSEYISKSESKFSLGESHIIELLSAQQKKDQVLNNLGELDWKIKELYNDLYKITQSEKAFLVQSPEYKKHSIVSLGIGENHPALRYNQAKIYNAEKTSTTNYNQRLPEIRFSLFNGLASVNNSDLFPGFELGLSMPLSKKQYKNRLAADKIEIDILKLRAKDTKYQLTIKEDFLIRKLANISSRLESFDNTLQVSSNELKLASEKAINQGVIDYFEYLIILENSQQTKLKKLALIHEQNQVVIELKYLLI